MEEIVIKKYKTSDNTVFKNKDDAIKHQQFIDLPNCENCKGEGFVYEDAGYDCWGKRDYWSNKCPVCNGSGKQDSSYEETIKEFETFKELQKKFG